MIWRNRRQFQKRSSFTAGETSIDSGPIEGMGWAPPVGGLIKGSLVLIRPAKGVLSFFAQEPPRVFVPEPPLRSGGTCGVRRAPSCFVPEPLDEMGPTCFNPEPRLCILLL